MSRGLLAEGVLTILLAYQRYFVKYKHYKKHLNHNVKIIICVNLGLTDYYSATASTLDTLPTRRFKRYLFAYIGLSNF